MDRFGPALRASLLAHGASPGFVEAEMKEVDAWRLAKTTTRSVVGIRKDSRVH
jgi:hypothetical protein